MADGTIVELNTMDGLGWIELEGGGRVRFGATALHDFPSIPTVGTRVTVLGTTAGYGGVIKAVRVVPFGWAAKAAPAAKDHAAALHLLGLEASLARASWPKTFAALLAHYALPSARPEVERDLAFAVSEGGKDVLAQPLLEGWLGRPILHDLIGYAGDALYLLGHERDTWADEDRPCLYRLEGTKGVLYLRRTVAACRAVHALDIEGLFLGLVLHPDTEAAANGIFRADGAQPAFRDHAPGCPRCQANLRRIGDKYGRDQLDAAFTDLLR